jgi:serine/threonine-protein kinase
LLVDTKNGKDWVKVVDFEASNQQATENFYKSNQQQNAQAVFYLSPEQCSETAEADARSDIYALGIILYEMLAGRMPFTGESATDVMLKHAQEIPPSLLALRPDLPPAIEQVVQRALAKQPAQRFQSATDFSDALVRASEGAPTAFREEDTIVRPNFAAAAAAPIADSASDARWRTAFVVLAGISLLSAGLFFFTQGKRTTPGTEAADPSAQAVQPINPATGTAEQNLLDFSNITPNGSIDPSVIPSGPPAAAPPAGGGAGFPIDRIPQGIYPPGYIYPNSNSQFMEPDGAVIPNANRPANTANANVGNRNQNVNAANTRTPTNVNAAPSPTPTTQPAATPEATPAAKPTPAPATKPTPQRAPANKPPVPKPTEESTEKSTQSISERVSEQSSE